MLPCDPGPGGVEDCLYGPSAQRVSSVRVSVSVCWVFPRRLVLTEVMRPPGHNTQHRETTRCYPVL